MNRRALPALVLVLAVVGVSAAEARPPHTVILATATSTQDSGLLDALLPLLAEHRGIEVKVLAVGTGEALAMGQRGDADVLLTHSPADEERFMAEGYGLLRLPVMHNDFVLAGPPSDPAGARGLEVQEALRRIAAAQARWASRGDRSGAHQREIALWHQAGLPQPSWAGAISTGQGMGETARIASETASYTLLDRGTYLALGSTLRLDIISEGGSHLLNPYHVVVVDPAKVPGVHADKARELAEWLTSAEAQALIGTFGTARFGRPLFVPDAPPSPSQAGAEAGRSGAAVLPELANILAVSLLVSGVAIAVSMILGVPLGIFLGLERFWGRHLIVTLVNTGMGLPPVVVGLVVFLLLARSGPFGGLNLLYTPSAMIVAQVVIATPLVVGVTLAAIQGLDERVRLQILSLGASHLQLYWKLVQEARLSLVAALAAGLGSIISEVGAVMMVGGNIRFQTRVMTTAIVLETRQGNFTLAIALSVLLLGAAMLVNWALTSVQQRGRT